MRTALLQSSGRPGSTVENLKVLDDAADRAAAAGAGLLVAPEMFLTGYAIGDDIARLAEPADGTRLANYRKTHLFGCFERDHFTPGDRQIVQAELHGVRVGILICYDVEFPENVRAHALAGTDLLVVPTAQMHPFQFVAESMIPVRAFENQMYVAYVNRVGPEGEFEFVGLSTLAGPDGIARTRAGRGEELVLADADPDFLAASREANPYLKDRRPGLYGSLV